MRAVKRWYHRKIADMKIYPRSLEVAGLLQTHFDLEDMPHLRRAGTAGHDNNYFVEHPADGHVMGVLRLVNPHRTRPNPKADQPFIFEQPAARLEREWNAYARGSDLGLTPKPLWRTDDALLCEYLPYTTLLRLQEDDPYKSWEIIVHAAQRIRDLHTTGITHMDICLANMLSDENLAPAVFVDFEYAPAFHISPALQRTYDHLRLIESSWKYIPANLRGNFAPWLDVFVTALDADMKAAGIDMLRPALSRMLADDTMRLAIESLFTQE